jgi:nucleotide-binding universal stress UspA family protein
MKVVLSVGRLEGEGDEAFRWCIDHFGPGDAVIVVAGVNMLGEFVLGLPPFDALGGEPALVHQIERRYCEPLLAKGVACDAKLVPHGQARAVTEVARQEGADLIVIGKRRHGRVGGALHDETASHVLHHPPCPVVVVPIGGLTALSSG